MPMGLAQTAVVSWLLTVVISVAPAHAESICLPCKPAIAQFYIRPPSQPVSPSAFATQFMVREVQEQFRITPTGFQTEKLRYAELRLAEFYGHDAAKFEQGWWTVNNSGSELPPARYSRESGIRY